MARGGRGGASWVPALAPCALGAAAAALAPRCSLPASLSLSPLPPALRVFPPHSNPCGGPGRARSLGAECPRCGPAAMATKIDKEACRAAYNLVRDDGSAVIW